MALRQGVDHKPCALRSAINAAGEPGAHPPHLRAVMPRKSPGDLHTTEGEGFHLPECDEIGKCDIETGDVELSPFIGVAVSSEVGIAFHQVDGGTVPQGEDEAPF